MNSTSYIKAEEDYPLLKAIFMALTNYVWIVPVALGITGNILTILVARRKHNRKMSPCVNMIAMAVSDSFFLLEVTLSYQGHMDGAVDKKIRGLVWK
jgi:type IV secretory pathway protease TraF